MRTDHKPLTYILGPKQEIPLTIASRLQRWFYYASKFNYKIEYISTFQNGNCDALSRLPVEDNTPVFDSEFTSLNYVCEGVSVLDASAIAKETQRDETLCKILRYIANGWPDDKHLSDVEKYYYHKRNELTLEKGCILWGIRVIIPYMLQSKVL